MAGNSSGNGGRRPGDDAGSIKTLVGAPIRGLAERRRGVVTTLSGSDMGRVVAIPTGAVLRLGRSDECALRIEDASLSRVHASIQHVGGDSHLFRDENSTNGSYINETRVEAPVVLRDGDRIVLGASTTLRFSLVDEAEEQALRRVYEAARRDALTGIPNRKAFDERLEAEFAFALRHSVPLSLVMLDVDLFKRVNDNHGHPAGDAVLKAVAATLAGAVRTEDSLARYGGEEFGLIVRGIDGANTSIMAERLRQAVADSVVHFNGHALRVTISAGVASIACCEGPPRRETLLALADSRLYRAKQLGRNRVVGPDG